MKIQHTIRAFAVCLVVAVSVSFAVGQTSDYRLSAAYTYKNLSVFLIHGKDASKNANVLTLQEALEKRLFVVYETSEVNELEVENLSKTFDVFIQSGDIVKGGKQDRVLAVSIIIPARSGRIRIDAYCVESGRWTKRGNEESTKFTSSNDRVVTKDLKIAANGARSQSDVWAQVSEAQAKLSKSLGGDVTASPSRSSLQLTLENKDVVATVDDYVKNLGNIINGRSDVIGYAVAINGKINSADVYVSSALFKKLWPKMLKASATEAVSESHGVRLAEPVKLDQVKSFIQESDKAAARDQKLSAGASLTTREDNENIMFETRDDRSKAVVHRSYVKKD
jgi:hypothetical protein